MNYRKIAQRKWPRAEWIVGEGRYALVAYCRCTTVTLWDALKQANEKKEIIDKTACGGMCVGDHEIVDLNIRNP